MKCTKFNDLMKTKTEYNTNLFKQKEAEAQLILSFGNLSNRPQVACVQK